MAEYHALVAGMPVVNATDAEPVLDVATFKSSYMPQLNKGDRQLVAMYLHRYDNRNLLALMQDDAAWDDRGIYSREELQAVIEAVERGDKCDEVCPYIVTFLTEDKRLPEGVLAEDALALRYMEYARGLKNKFVQQWFEFEQNVSNIIVALTARQVGIDARCSIVGNDIISTQLRESKEQDFGLKTILPYFGNLLAVTKISDPVQKERALDELKWRWLEDETFFHYFTVEKVFAFLVKLDIIERWSRLDAETGQQLFRRLIDNIKSEAQVPEEFSR